MKWIQRGQKKENNKMKKSINLKQKDIRENQWNKVLVFSKDQLNWQTLNKSGKERERRYKLWIPDKIQEKITTGLAKSKG